MKPTTLLCAHIPQLQDELNALPSRGFCSDVRSLRTSIGTVPRDGRHDFLTTQLKEYPQQFCCVIAVALLKKWRYAITDWGTDVDLPDAFVEVYQPLDPYLDYVMGLDHASRRTPR